MTMEKSIEWFKKPGGDAKATVLFGGDFCPIGRYEQEVLAGRPVFDARIKEMIEASDLFAVNLEAPLCDKSLSANSPAGSGLRANGRVAEWMKSAGVDIAGIANNHLRDFKDGGVLQTIENLDRADIIHTGGGRDISEAGRMLTVNAGGLKIGIWALAEKEQNLATGSRAGTAFFNPDADVHVIPELRRQVDFLVLFVHAGHEFGLVPSPRIRAAYRAYIDAGADLVVGHHPHVPQGIEQYKSGWIAYSLGNLVFDHAYLHKFKDTDHGYLLNVGISRHSIEKLEVVPYFMKDFTTVETCSSSALADYEKLLNEISASIVDDAKFEESWERFVTWRWNHSRRDFHRNLSKNFINEADPSFIRMLKNAYDCPTHHEIMGKAMELILDGKLPR